MAIFNSDLVPKRLRHRGLYQGKEQSLAAAFRLTPGASYTTADLINMVPLGENVRPTEIRVFTKKVSGTPVLTGGSFSVGVAPYQATDLIRPDNKVFSPLTAAPTRYGAAATVGTAAITLQTTVPPSDNTKWGPFYVTLTPTNATSVAGGDMDIILQVVFEGEIQEENRVYNEWMNFKYKN